jgi:hypothetical protein
MKTYTLEIAADSDPFILIESAQPFPAIAVGDLLNPGAWDSEAWPSVQDFAGKLLEVAAVEHIIMQSPGSAWPVKFKTCLFCKPVSNSPESRGR